MREDRRSGFSRALSRRHQLVPRALPLALLNHAGGTAPSRIAPVPLSPTTPQLRRPVPDRPRTMKISVKTLKGNHFDLQVAEDELVSSVKGKIEKSQGSDAFPCAQQLLIHQGKVLKDETTMADNKVSEGGFLVVMLTKAKAAPAGPPASSSGGVQAPVAATPAAPAPSPAPATPAAPAPAPAVVAPPPSSAPVAGAPAGTGDGYGQAASNLVAGSALESTVQQIIDMGGGTWDRDTVLRALRAAFNNPERAVEYLYSGIPEAAEVPAPVARAPPAAAPAAAAPAAPAPAAPAAPQGPNAAPLDLFPQVTVWRLNIRAPVFHGWYTDAAMLLV
ncbi:hypothetical protein M758_8G160100 [Ceratodon purpureus]|nr:hypothetical protein M758_8G160100 [Ceratodon purpureus]